MIVLQYFSLREINGVKLQGNIDDIVIGKGWLFPLEAISKAANGDGKVDMYTNSSDKKC